MRATLEITDVTADWNPPFQKKVEKHEVTVGVDDSFGTIKEKNGYIFRILKMGADRILIKFDEHFTIKGGEHPTNRETWLNTDEEKSFTFLWGNKGLTKRLKLLKIEDETQKEPETKEDDYFTLQQEQTTTQTEDNTQENTKQQTQEQDTTETNFPQNPTY